MNRPDGRNPQPRLAILRAAAGLTLLAVGTVDAAAQDRSLVVTPRHRRAPPPVPSPLFPGAPIPWSGSPLLTPQTLSIVDGQTRFLTSGPAEDRCPGDRIIFVPGVVNPFRPTLPGDGAFMCRGDAVAQGFIGP